MNWRPLAYNKPYLYSGCRLPTLQTSFKLEKCSIVETIRREKEIAQEKSKVILVSKLLPRRIVFLRYSIFLQLDPPGLKTFK